MGAWQEVEYNRDKRNGNDNRSQSLNDEEELRRQQDNPIPNVDDEQQLNEDLFYPKILNEPPTLEEEPTSEGIQQTTPEEEQQSTKEEEATGEPPTTEGQQSTEEEETQPTQQTQPTEEEEELTSQPKPSAKQPQPQPSSQAKPQQELDSQPSLSVIIQIISSPSNTSLQKDSTEAEIAERVKSNYLRYLDKISDLLIKSELINRLRSYLLSPIEITETHFNLASKKFRSYYQKWEKLPRNKSGDIKAFVLNKLDNEFGQKLSKISTGNNFEQIKKLLEEYSILKAIIESYPKDELLKQTE